MPEIWHISGICQLRISAEKVREKPESGLGIFRENWQQNRENQSGPSGNTDCVPLKVNTFNNLKKGYININIHLIKKHHSEHADFLPVIRDGISENGPQWP